MVKGMIFLGLGKKFKDFKTRWAWRVFQKTENRGQLRGKIVKDFKQLKPLSKQKAFERTVDLFSPTIWFHKLKSILRRSHRKKP